MSDDSLDSRKDMGRHSSRESVLEHGVVRHDDVQRAKVRVRSKIGITEVEREILYSHHGPIYKTIEGWAYAARTSASPCRFI